MIDLYSIGMESQAAWHQMQELCKACGQPFPPFAPPPDTAARDALPDPLFTH